MHGRNRWSSRVRTGSSRRISVRQSTSRIQSACGLLRRNHSRAENSKRNHTESNRHVTRFLLCVARRGGEAEWHSRRRKQKQITLSKGKHRPAITALGGPAPLLSALSRIGGA